MPWWLGVGLCGQKKETPKLVVRAPVPVQRSLHKRSHWHLFERVCQNTDCGLQIACSSSQEVGLVGWLTKPYWFNLNAFLPPVDLVGTWDIQKTPKERTLALAKALQSCVEQLGVPPVMLYDAAQELQRCMAHIMPLEEGDIVESLLLTVTDDEPIMSPTPMVEAMLLGEPQATAMHPPRCPEDAPKPEGAAGLGKTAADSWVVQKQPSPPPPGFKLLLPVLRPPLLKDMPLLAVIPKGEDIWPLARIPNEAQLDLTFISTM